LLVPGHCDPTVNLHDWYVGVRGLGTAEARVESVWPVAARGALFCFRSCAVRRCRVNTINIGHCEAVIATRYVRRHAPRRDAMNTDERQLITRLFESRRGFGPPDKDREAEALINQLVRANPDAAYMLVQ